MQGWFVFKTTYNIAPIPLIIMPVMEWRRVALMSYEDHSSGYFSDDKSMTLV